MTSFRLYSQKNKNLEFLKSESSTRKCWLLENFDHSKMLIAWNCWPLEIIDKRINIRRNSFFKKTAGNLYVGGFWGEKSRDANGFSIWPHLTLTGPLVKIGGLRHIFESYLYRYDNMFYRFCNLSVTPFRQQNIFKTFF